MRRIDLENHFYDQSLIDALAARACPTPPPPPPPPPPATTVRPT